MAEHVTGQHRLNAYEAGKYKSYFYPLFFGLALPLFIGLLKPILLFAFLDYLFFFILFLPVFVFITACFFWVRDEKSLILSLIRQITIVPPFIAYGADIKKGGIPRATIALILINTLLFLVLPEEIYELYMFYPVHDPRVDELVFAFFFSAFLHAGPAHLFFNMLFLWVFGSTVEPRLGWRKFLGLYFLCIVTSQVLVIALLSLKSLSQNDFSVLTDFHSLGASGAISGVMGIFLVRCFFARVKFALPFFWFPNLSIPIRLPVLLVISLFFTFDLIGSVLQFNHEVMTDYWAHVGGYFGGVGFAFLFGLHHAAAEESVEVSAERMSRSSYPEKAREVYSDILAQDSENQKGLEHFFERYMKVQSDQAYEYFARLYQLYRKKDFFKALKFFNNHYPKYMNALPGDALLELGLHSYEVQDLDKAYWCLHLASRKEGDWQAQASSAREQVLSEKRALQR